LEILCRNVGCRKLRQGYRRRPRAKEGSADSFGKCLLCIFVEPNVFAMAAAYFTEGGNVGTNNAAPSKEGFSYRKTESLHHGGRDQQVAIAITPLHLFIGKTTQQRHAVLKLCKRDEPLHRFRLRSVNAYDDQAGSCAELVREQKSPEYPQQQQQILVLAMLRHTQQKRLASPSRHWAPV
jgi:hypothetical protein